MNHPLTHPILHCLEQRAKAIGNPDGWDWVLRDPVVSSFSPSLHFLEEEGRLELGNSLRQTCQGLYWHTAAHWVRREHRLTPILDELTTAQIPVIPLKGAALLESIYRKIGLRNMVDVDILVRQADFIPTAEILLAHGMQPRWSDSSGDLFAFTQLPAQFWPGELSFYDQDGLHIDLHSNLVTYHWFKVGYPVDIEKVWERSIHSPPGEKSPWKRMLSPYDMLAHMCLHLALHGLYGVKNFFDVDQWLRNLPDQWDWVRYLNLVNAWQLGAVCYHVFTFCQHFFNTPVPETVMKQLTPSRSNRWGVRQLITPQAILSNRPALGKRYPSLVKFALFDGAGTKFYTITNLLFPRKSLLQRNPAYRGIIRHWAHLVQVIWRGD